MGTPEQPLFDRGGASPVHQGAVESHLLLLEQLPRAVRFGVVRQYGSQNDFRIQRSQKGRHASRSAEPLLGVRHIQYWNGRLGTDPIDVSPQIAVQHHVADQQNLRVGHALKKLGKRIVQIGGSR